jgi:DNA-directed RNA polymerase subunit RPC12/RpoP
MLCPKCKSENAHRSHRAGLREHLTSIVGYFPYRCRDCSFRFLNFRYSLPEPVATPLRGAEKEIAATRGSLRWKQTRRELALYVSALTLFVIVLYFLTREPSIGN